MLKFTKPFTGRVGIKAKSVSQDSKVMLFLSQYTLPPKIRKQMMEERRRVNVLGIVNICEIQNTGLLLSLRKPRCSETWPRLFSVAGNSSVCAVTIKSGSLRIDQGLIYRYICMDLCM